MYQDTYRPTHTHTHTHTHKFGLVYALSIFQYSDAFEVPYESINSPTLSSI